MPRFNPSMLNPLDYQPWRYTTQPTYNPDGSEATPGVKQFLNGAFILLSDEILTIMRAKLTPAERTELSSWIDRRTEDQCALWNVPVWAGNNAAVIVRIPAAVWDDPTTAPPAKVRNYFQMLWR